MDGGIATCLSNVLFCEGVTGGVGPRGDSNTAAFASRLARPP